MYNGWYRLYRLADTFYRVASESVSEKLAIENLGIWNTLQSVYATEVGINLADPHDLDLFLELSQVFRELVDRLGHLPEKQEFIIAWRSWLQFKSMRQLQSPAFTEQMEQQTSHIV